MATGAAGVVVGARAKALAADLKHRLGLLREALELGRERQTLARRTSRHGETAWSNASTRRSAGSGA